jgi:hypothetical protein
MLAGGVFAVIQALERKQMLLSCWFELSMVTHVIAIALAVLTPIAFRASGVENGDGHTLSITNQHGWALERGYIASIVLN